MRVGIDFDNTIVNTKTIAKKYLDIELPNNNMKDYHELGDEASKFFIKYALKITNDLSVFDFVKETFEYCKKNNIEVILVSRRGFNFEPLVDATYDFLEKNNIKFDETYCKITEKGKFCKEHNIDLFIDDKESELEKAKNEGIKVLKYGEISDKYDYALSWKEVLEIIQKGAK